MKLYPKIPSIFLSNEKGTEPVKFSEGGDEKTADLYIKFKHGDNQAEVIRYYHCHPRMEKWSLVPTADQASKFVDTLLGILKAEEILAYRESREVPVFYSEVGIRVPSVDLNPDVSDRPWLRFYPDYTPTELVLLDRVPDDTIVIGYTS